MGRTEKEVNVKNRNDDVVKEKKFKFTRNSDKLNFSN